MTEGQFLTIDLAECKVDPDDPDEPAVTHTIDAEISPGAPIDLSVGDAVRFTNFADGPWWVNRGFALRRPDDELVLAGLSTAELPGENFGPPPDLLAPFTFTVEVACELEPLDTECDFICDNCYQLRRDVLRLQWAAAIIFIGDPQIRHVGDAVIEHDAQYADRQEDRETYREGTYEACSRWRTNGLRNQAGRFCGMLRG